MQLTIEQEGDVLVLRGVVDGFTVDQIAEVLKEDRNWVLDMLEVKFLASCGVGLLLKREMELKGKEMCLTIRKPSKTVRETLRMTYIDRVIKLED